jgi:ArsR family transcriptional regulator
MIKYNIDKHRYEEVILMENIINIFKALSDETRLLIVSKLKDEEELCACKLLELVNCNQSTLSHHMKILVDCGLVTARKEWKWVHYSLNKEKLNIVLDFFK